MKYVTFRTEGGADSGLIPSLLDMLGYREIHNEDIPDEDIPDDIEELYGVTFKVADDTDLDELKQEMEYITDKYPKFADMHRCSQTLKFGLEPDEQWFKRDDKYPLSPEDLEKRMNKRIWAWLLELRNLSGEVARVKDGKVELYENALAASKLTGVPMVSILADLREGKDSRYYSTLPWTKETGFHCKVKD